MNKKNSLYLPLSTRYRNAHKAAVYNWRRKLWLYINIKSTYNVYANIKNTYNEIINSDKGRNKYKGCFIKKCFIKRTCSYPYYYN